MEVKPKLLRRTGFRVLNDLTEGVLYFFITEVLAGSLRFLSTRLTQDFGIAVVVRYSFLIAEVALVLTGVIVLVISLVRLVVRFVRGPRPLS